MLNPPMPPSLPPAIPTGLTPNNSAGSTQAAQPVAVPAAGPIGQADVKQIALGGPAADSLFGSQHIVMVAILPIEQQLTRAMSQLVTMIQGMIGGSSGKDNVIQGGGDIKQITAGGPDQGSTVVPDHASGANAALSLYGFSAQRRGLISKVKAMVAEEAARTGVTNQVALFRIRQEELTASKINELAAFMEAHQSSVSPADARQAMLIAQDAASTGAVNQAAIARLMQTIAAR